MKVMFDSFKSWRLSMLSAARKFLRGLCALLLWTIGGLLSLCRWLWHVTVRAIGSYPEAALVMTLTLCLSTFALTFVSSRARLATAEYQRDSLSYKLSQMERYGTHEFVTIGEDTIDVGGVYDKP